MRSLKTFCTIVIIFISLSKAFGQTEATFYTSMGSFKVILTDTLTPVTVDSFIARVNEKFYDGTIFHRVIDNFMIQGGDPTGTGFGGPGYTIPDEFHSALKNVPKALAMANAGPNTGGSQFFINLVTNSHLNNKHTVFGMVSTNFNVVQDIGDVTVDANDRPLTDVVLDSVRITQFPTSVGHLANMPLAGPFPNPSNGVFYIEPRGLTTGVQIFNIAGRLLYSTTTREKSEVDLRHWPKGVYMLRMVSPSGKFNHKLVFQ
jgi:peptidyl-prolyl cis-trans isomerase A (cyclophilin A)